MTKPAFDPLGVWSLDFWAQPTRQRDEAFAELRRDRPVSWNPPAEGSLMPHEDEGFWAVVRHEDVVYVSRHPETFSSAQGVMFEDVPEDFIEATSSFLPMDAPRHTHLRRLGSSAFTPRQVARIDQQIADQANRIVSEMLDAGGGDFVAQVARPMPLWTISEMMGVPESVRDDYATAANGMVGWNDPTIRGDKEPMELLFESMLALHAIARGLATHRRERPAEDLMTSLVQAEVEGSSLTDDEIAAFFVLLAVAGNDTTRNTISHGVIALGAHRDDARWVADDLEARLPRAVDEMLRWATPVMTFRRTVATDTELGGRQIDAGDKVVMFYSSANRDERVFDDPWRFDVRRDPNNHLAFGGGGAHFCLGASLARTQLRRVFAELLTRAPDLSVGEPERLMGNFIDGIMSMPYEVSA